MGLDLSTALNMFLRQSIVDDGMPFHATRQSPTSAQARREAENHVRTTQFILARTGTHDQLY
ncbi:hypothetical protein [Bifidobacterium simiarum]|nr:hypothetical protein [Bifidobacterium simiarum]